MSKRTLFLPLLLLLFHQVLLAQAPPIEWIKCFGGNYADFGPAIEPTSDGGYIMTGIVYGGGGDVSGYHGNYDIGDYWVVKMDHQGTIQWSKCLGGTFFDQGQMVHEAPDGGFLVLGESSSLPGDGDVTTTNHGGSDYWLVKLNAAGNILWQKSYGGEQNEYGYDFRFTADGGCILTGRTESHGGDVTGYHGGLDCWIVKVNSTGAIDWQRCVGGSKDDEAYSVEVLNDGYIFTGYTSSNDGDVSGFHGGTFDMLVGKLDLSGNLVWTKTLGGDQQDMGEYIVKGSDGGVVVGGWTGSNNGDASGNHGDADFWLVKLNDQTGAIVWQHCYGGSFNEQAYSLAVTADGGYVMGGSAESKDGQVTCMNNSLGHAAWLVKTSPTGTLIWQRTFSGGNNDIINGVKSTSDGGVVAAGYTGPSSFPNYHKDLDPNRTVGDLFVVKLGPATATSPITLSISAPPVNTCARSVITLTATATNAPAGTVYKWFRNGTDVNNSTSTYTSANFANSDQVYCQITVATSSANDCALTPTPPVSTLYTSNTVILSVSPLDMPKVSISVDAVSACSGSPLTFTAAVTGGGSGPVYQWLVNGSPVGTGGLVYSSAGLADGSLVSCVYSDNTACTVPGANVSNVIKAAVIPSVTPSVDIVASATTVCAGSPVSFTATAVNGGTAPAYQWSVNGGATGPGGASYSISSLADGDVVSCSLTSSAACSNPVTVSSNAVMVTVKPSVSSSVKIDTDPVLCSGLPAIFKALAQNVVSPAYDWQVNGVSVGSGATYTTSTLINGDIVSCRLSEKQGCALPSTANITAIVYPTPVVGSVPPLTLSKGQEVVLSLPVTGDIAIYSWSPVTDLSDAAVSNPVATPRKSTVYTLEVTSQDGCKASGNIILKVFSTLTVPGAFTPNGDGHNDIFYVMGGSLGSRIKDLGIFNRWGQRIFQVHDVPPDDPGFGWNGRINGEAAPPGAYVYEILMSFADGTQQVYKGTLMLVR